MHHLSRSVYIFIYTFLAVLLLTGCALADQFTTVPAPIQTEKTNANKTKPTFDSTESIQNLSFIAESQSGASSISIWQDKKGAYYVFLPSYCGLKTTKLLSKNGIIINDRYYRNGTYLEGLEMDNTYDVITYAQDGTYYDTGEIMFMQSRNIPAMFIDTASGSMDYIYQSKNNKEKGALTMINKDGIIEYNGELDFVEGRGNYTWQLSKRSIDIKLKDTTDLLGMGEAKKWCLISNYMDQSFIRNKMAYDLASEAGLPYAVDCEYVDLYLNNEYYGMYLLVEKIEVGDKRIDIANLGDATEAVNAQKLQNYTQFRDVEEPYTVSIGFNIENNPDDITGGYLVELDLPDRYEKEASGFMTDDRVHMVIKEPKYASREQVRYIGGLFQQFENALKSGSDTAYLKYIDLDSWIHMYMIEELFVNYDTMWSSMYFYKDADVNGQRSKIFAGPVWDFDLSIGNYKVQIENPKKIYAGQKGWFEDLYSKKSFYKKVVETYRDVYLPLLEKMLSTGIDAYVEKTQASVAMNNVRWPLPDEPTNWDYLALGGQRENVAYIKDFLKSRIDFLNSLWVDGEKYYTITADQAPYAREIYYMVKPGEVLGEIYTPDIEGRVFNGWVDSKTGKLYDPNQPIKRDTRLKAAFTSINELTAQQVESLNIDLKTCTDLHLYLKKLQFSDYTVFISFNNEATYALTSDAISIMQQLGLTANIDDLTGISYIAITQNGSVLAEQADFAKLTQSGTLMNGTAYEITSAAGNSGRMASIIIDGTDYAVNSRGMNIVVYDDSTGKIVDSVCFDTYWDTDSAKRK